MLEPTDQERLGIVHLQVADVIDESGWCFVFAFSEGRYRYVHWADAVDLVMQHRATLADPINNLNLEIGGR